jgi:biotin carboxyl carrier protein
VALAGRLAATENEGEAHSPWLAASGATGLRLNAAPVNSALVYVNDLAMNLAFDFDAPAAFSTGGKDEVIVFDGGAALCVTALRQADRLNVGVLGDGVIRAPMPGRIVAVAVTAGAAVTAGQTLIVLEAMKMEHALVAPAQGEVTEVLVSQGDQVAEGATLARLRATG